ncbi:hypothetical protein EV646_102188 [Kribbella antiqua]|uniref:Uncharacterized protein n=1 Tax=Kribbella antiqua TaxID=2512217 RepID=A0A4R2J474_9ACTN|nr:hypothetical protein EV646_102188 [Kribbella antiqua]
MSGHCDGLAVRCQPEIFVVVEGRAVWPVVKWLHRAKFRGL